MSPAPSPTDPTPAAAVRVPGTSAIRAEGAGEPAPEPAGSRDLPLAERMRRRRELVLGAALAAVIGGVVYFERRLALESLALPVADSVLFVVLTALNVILILLLTFLIARNLVKLVFERRSGILGAHLNAKFVLAFVTIACIPTAMLFGVAAFFLTTSIDAWFDSRVDRALDQSREVADAYYGNAQRDALFWGRRIADQVTGERLLREEARERLAELVHALQRHYGLGVVEVFSGTGEELVAVVNPEIPTATFSRADSALVQEALAGKATSRVEPSGSGDVIRGAVPVFSSFRSDEAVGAVVVNYVLPKSLSRKVGEIHAALDEYRRLQPNASHVRRLYLMELLLAFLVILLLATWWGFRMAKSVTGPIGALAAGTEAVARGDLDVEVESTSDDEIGLLVRSFNAMTRDLREARSGLERSNAELEQRRRSMEVVLRSVSAGVVSIDADGRIGMLNPSAQRFLGIPPGTPVAGRKLEEVLARPEQIEVVRDLAAKLRPGVRDMIRQQVQMPAVPGDEPMTLLVTLNLLRDGDRGNLGMVIVYDDYSQLVKAQRMEAWREVARRIAHEIKNPLTPIQLSAQRIRRRFRDRLAREPEDAQVFDECVDAITSQVDGLKLLVNEFSTFARLPEASPRPDDLNRLVAEVVASYQGSEDVALETELDATLPSVELDREQIRRVLTNLLDNAIAAVGEARKSGLESATQVTVRTVHDTPLGSVRFEVEDSGLGIRAEDRRHIFEPYFSTKRGGTGLGLAIVARIVADHRGYVRVHDRRPHGTSFVIELPVRA